MRIIFTILIIVFAISCTSTNNNRSNEQVLVKLPNSVSIPEDGSTPITGEEFVSKENPTITFTQYGEKKFVKTGQEVNFIYEGIDPEESFLLFESTDGGYFLQLVKSDEPTEINFTRMCQTFVVSSPTMTNISIDEKIKFEQIIWTPRKDGTWEVRIGSTNRGCKSEALDRLNKLRTNEYEKNAKSTIIK